MEVGELAPGLWWWTARHPEWEAGHTWEPDVRCFYVEAGEATVLVDPLVPADEVERFWRALDRDVERRGLPVAVLLTEAAHARSAGEVALRYGGAVWGHEAARAKVGAAPFHAVAAGDEPPGACVLPAPGPSATPLWLPSHGALAVGDALIALGGELRVWAEDVAEELRGWLELPVERLLVAHGADVSGGAGELAAALERPPCPVH